MELTALDENWNIGLSRAIHVIHVRERFGRLQLLDYMQMDKGQTILPDLKRE